MTDSATAKQTTKNVLTNEQIACLQALGTTVYEPIRSLEVSQFSWIDSLCEWLSISTENCQFTGDKIHFDESTSSLLLPRTTYLTELAFKKSVYLALRSRFAE